MKNKGYGYYSEVKMNTEHKAELKARHDKENKKYLIKIQNEELADNEGEILRVIVQSEYKSIEEALHKIELDLMTNLHYGLRK
jgi:hypothetical protein